MKTKVQKMKSLSNDLDSELDTLITGWWEPLLCQKGANLINDLPETLKEIEDCLANLEVINKQMKLVLWGKGTKKWLES